MAKYAEMKNADLQSLLKERGLPATGKKADLVERLTKDDEEKNAAKATEPAAPAEKPTTTEEDEIDWDDEEPATSKPAAVPETAGEGVALDPHAIPDPVADIDSSKAVELTAGAPGEEKVQEQAEVNTEQKTEEQVEENKAPPPSYAMGLAASNIDEEIEKRKKRAAKFGTTFNEDENLKKLEREKRFGTTGPPKGLDEALPERPMKRGRDANDHGSRGRNKRRGDKFGGRRQGGNRDAGRQRYDASTNDKGASTGSNWMSEADRKKAEERKKKWAASS